MSFFGCTAIVTGGASGIGLAISERLADDGAKVAIFDVDADAGEHAVKEISEEGGVAIACQVDVSDRAAVDAAVERVRSELGHVLVLVNAAGKDSFERFQDVTTEMWEQIIAINLTGTFHVTQSVLPDMVDAKWGRIVNISSSSAQTGAVMMAPYSASKGGMIALTKTLALELGPLGITVNTIPPGAIDTPMSRRAASEGRFGGGTLEDVGRHLPVKRIGIPEDIAAACAYLVSDEAGYVTGQIIGVNGGRVT
ncbi:MAG TPA: SDR family NAD(P)-dependent oxidoreductase [Acidimicrobiia bacterium]|nr:SDR family NAD(P)-dependent oxidoreductase [Acidimicrobiia bacterium]